MDPDSFLSLLSFLPLLIPTGSIIALSVIILLLCIFAFTSGSIKNPLKLSRKPEPSPDTIEKTTELPEKWEMIQGIIGLFKKSAVEIMTPRVDVAGLSIKTPFKDVVEFVIKVGYSRIPVYSENQDDIRGILYTKDLLLYINEDSGFHWQSLIRPAFFVPENKKIDDLLEDFRKDKIHMAVVVDEFGGTSGIVTLEDILEEIVGEIDDEYDDENIKYTRLADGSFIFDAKILLIDFFRVTQLDAAGFGKLAEEADTLAGLILEIKGDFPKEKELVQYKNYSFRILDMDKIRILKVKFTINELQEGNAEVNKEDEK